MEKITSWLIQPTVHTPGEVRAWAEDMLLPTYETGEEEKNPMFLEKRVYQGSSGAVYPYPVVEKIFDEKKDKKYRALFLENIYLKIMILPELGGRVQMAYDKVKKRHFVYYNQVIKPALVGLTGPWISGGIEFNWPQHHRPSTYLPTDSLIEENPDGSKTVWCNEVERMFRTKGMQGFTLHPDKAYLEIKVKVYNRTPFPQTFLWWANPAVVVNDTYKSVFPPDVHAVFDHGKRAVSGFPIATGEYYKQDYSAGVDISKYKNIPVPTSYMAIKSNYDFVGGYDDGVEAGLLHVADHHISPGKKQWTWGNGDFGVAWDRNLTDEDGPYIELMTGVYTDNQPDFSWLQPYEEKSWVQYFMPYTEVGYVKNATKDLIVGLHPDGEHVEVIVYATGRYSGLQVVLKKQDGQIVSEITTDMDPAHPFRTSISVPGVKEHDLLLEVYGADGKRMISYKGEKEEIKPVPDPAKAALDPEEIASMEQLFLTGLHLEQYRHATYNPLDYYREGLVREPKDIRCNNAMGLLLMRRGKFAGAQPYFQKAIDTLTERSPNPYDGEPFYNLGWSLKMQGHYEEAYSAFYKSTWNAAWKDPGFYALAQIAAIRQEWELALEHVEASLVRNWHNHKARQLKASLLRKLDRTAEALAWIEASLEIDKFNMGCYFEKYLLTHAQADLQVMNELMRGWVHGYIEYSLDYAGAGLYEEARLFLSQCIKEEASVYPIVYYALGYYASCNGEPEKAVTYYRKASAQSPDKCFPNRIEEVLILQDALRVNPEDARAWYYLGNFWYASRQYEDAVACWERSARIDRTYPTVLRNLALAYYNKFNEKSKALACMEEAFALDTTDARLLMELDQLYKKMHTGHRQRLAFLEAHLPLVEQRDDLFIERITLYNQLGEYETAKELAGQRTFHPWEGGEGKITGQYVLCRVELAKKAIAEKRYEDALALLKETDFYPLNLGEGKLANAEENEVDYYKGIAYAGLGDTVTARISFLKATEGSKEPVQAFFYNDQQPDKIFYQGLAWRELGEEDKARGCFNKLISHGRKHLFDICKIDYFAVSLPDLTIWDEDLNIRNLVHCYYVMALGHSGLGNDILANKYYDKVKELDPNKQVLRK
ncbi:MAG: DUF5107 domain-containing protein [Tannerellaceae bacterium]|nr:DUF5107 domain-containing protein [Tannerellaceae bacterium]